MYHDVDAGKSGSMYRIFFIVKYTFFTAARENVTLLTQLQQIMQTIE